MASLESSGGSCGTRFDVPQSTRAASLRGGVLCRSSVSVDNCAAVTLSLSQSSRTTDFSGMGGMGRCLEAKLWAGSVVTWMPKSSRGHLQTVDALDLKLSSSLESISRPLTFTSRDSIAFR